MTNTIPTDWEISCLDDLLDHNDLFCDGDWVESKDQDQEGQNRLIQLADIGDGSFLDKSRRFLNDNQFHSLGCTELREGDVLIARMPDPIGRACIFPRLSQRCATVVDVAIIRTQDLSPYFLMSTLNGDVVRGEIERLSAGSTRTRIGRSAISKIKFPVPPLVEQEKIADILTSVDDTIEHTQAQVAKLQDLKTATMNELLTRGIGHTEFRESELGLIPSSWEINEFQELFKEPIRDFGSFSTTKLIKFLDSGVPFIKSESVRDGKVDTKTLSYISEDVHQLLTKSYVENGNILLTKIGAIGRVAIYNGELGVCNSNAATAKIKVDTSKADNRYIAFQLRSERVMKSFELNVISTPPRINLTDIKSLKVLLPPLPEQEKIAEILTSLDDQIEAVESKLVQLESLKKSLMGDLLTGRVRVSVD